eukprot:scaffold8187_cov57-Skeletonema_menzelii.AAC.1
MKNEQLEADNAALSEENMILKEQIASLMAQNGVGACTMANSVGSIAERVKTRAKRRKLGRIATPPLAAYEAEVCHCKYKFPPMITSIPVDVKMEQVALTKGISNLLRSPFPGIRSQASG